jgi:hypothetical protein
MSAAATPWNGSAYEWKFACLREEDREATHGGIAKRRKLVMAVDDATGTFFKFAEYPPRLVHRGAPRENYTLDKLTSSG